MGREWGGGGKGIGISRRRYCVNDTFFLEWILYAVCMGVLSCSWGRGLEVVSMHVCVRIRHPVNSHMYPHLIFEDNSQYLTLWKIAMYLLHSKCLWTNGCRRC